MGIGMRGEISGFVLSAPLLPNAMVELCWRLCANHGPFGESGESQATRTSISTYVAMPRRFMRYSEE